MRFGSVCSGIEAASAAWRPLGWSAAWFSEIEPFPCAVLDYRYPDVPNLGDMTKIYDKETFKKEEIDVLVGGTPCQSFSIAGKRGGIADPRGALALAFCRIAKEKQPPWIVWENVPGVLSSGSGRDFAAFLGALEELGYSLAYRVLNAQYFGVPQRRRRVFVVGHRGDSFAEYVLFDGKGGSWNPAPREKEPKQKLPLLIEVPPPSEGAGGRGGGIKPSSGNVAHTILTGTKGSATAETYLICDPGCRETAATIKAGYYKCWNDSENMPNLIRGESDGETNVRRLMPVECERLQGFPDDYTLVPYRGKPAAECPDTPRYKALGNSIAVPVLRWIGERIEEIDTLGPNRVTPRPDPERLAQAMDDDELLYRCEEGFHDLREAIPYLREARNRFAQPGRRVPVPGNPTWTEWVQCNLHVTVRRVQQLLSAGAQNLAKPISLGSKQRKLRTGDWRGLLKATERRNAQVFGPVEDPERLAGAIRSFAQRIADRYARPGGKLVVSVSVKARK